MELALSLVLGAGLLLIAAAAARSPYAGLRLLLVLLPLHSGAVLLLRNVVAVDAVPLTLFSAWKEAVILGLVVACAAEFRDRWRSFGPVHWIALALTALIAGRAVVEVVLDPGDLVPVLFGARQLAEFLVVFLVVSVLRPSVNWFLGTARLAAPVLVFVAVFAIAQPSLGSVFYDQFFHAPGERLHHAYLVNIGDVRQFRAVGTFIAPNELGLGLVVYGAIFVLPLLATVRRWRLVATASMLIVIALVLTFSRSAWVGAFIGLIAAALLAHRTVIALWRRGQLLNVRARDMLLGLAAAAGGTLAIFVLVGGFTLFIGTISGTETSAAGRGESLGGGIDASLDHPGGLGLGTAGPRALELTGSAVLTENWYLLYSIQLGLVALVVLAAFVLTALVSVIRAVRRRLRTLRPEDANWVAQRYEASVMLGTLLALVAGLVGALVIPAMLDLPASIALWSSVAMVIGWGVQSRGHDAAAER